MRKDLKNCPLFEWQLMTQYSTVPNNKASAFRQLIACCQGASVSCDAKASTAVWHCLDCPAHPSGAGCYDSGSWGNLSCPEIVTGGQAHVSNLEWYETLMFWHLNCALGTPVQETATLLSEVISSLCVDSLNSTFSKSFLCRLLLVEHSAQCLQRNDTEIEPSKMRCANLETVTIYSSTGIFHFLTTSKKT